MLGSFRPACLTDARRARHSSTSQSISIARSIVLEGLTRRTSTAGSPAGREAIVRLVSSGVDRPARARAAEQLLRETRRGRLLADPPGDALETARERHAHDLERRRNGVAAASRIRSHRRRTSPQLTIAEAVADDRVAASDPAGIQSPGSSASSTRVESMRRTLPLGTLRRMTNVIDAPTAVKPINHWIGGQALRGDVGPQRLGLQPGDRASRPAPSTSRRVEEIDAAVAAAKAGIPRLARALAGAPRRDLLPHPRARPRAARGVRARCSPPSTARCSPTRWAR